MDADKKLLLDFLKSQRLLVLSSIDENGEPYTCNLYMGVGDDLKIYFVGPEDAKHSKQVLKNPTVAFSTAWFNEDDYSDRKGVQGKGVCRKATTDTDIETGISLHNKNYPQFKDRITVTWAKDESNGAHVWVIEPVYIKYWDDENFEEKTREFNFE